MGRYERSIKIAFDKQTGEILDADLVFDIAKNAFEIRRQYHEKNLLLSCCECEQDLIVSGSKYDRLHFKHKPGHDFCILADGELSPKEHEKFTEILKSKESERHKTLKNKIGQLLSGVEGVDIATIAIDNKFIIRDSEKRRPDVYCKYCDNELVFEIQLSDLSLGYILSRYEFYKKHGMFLIWILDNFDIHNQGTLERDIKYLTKYENFFKLDEKAEKFQLECEYKFPFLTDDNKLLTKWIKKSIALNQVKFDREGYQIYYYNFGDNRTKAEAEQKKKTEEIKEAERKRIAEQRLTNAKIRANKIINEIKLLRTKKSQFFSSVIFQINVLDAHDLQVLNSILTFTDKTKHKEPVLLHWIKSATQDDVAFIEFILNCNQIEIDVNEIDSDGKSAFQAVYENQNIYKYIPIKSLFKRGYKLTNEDIILFSSLTNIESDRKNDIITYNICNNLSDRSLTEAVFTHTKLLFIIESIKQKKMIGFNYKSSEWIAFANNAIQYHSEYWEYIELAFKKYGLWETLILSDKKGTFQKKVESFYSEMPNQKYDFDEVFRDLYPDLENQE